ncbi:FGGY-family carbohydrate kinase [Bradyrhizobium diazoefficiens]|uniref:FGGY-family carbohydrate kinase n=1 Tax=Bradyrhizobium sp. WYCCWR 12699 TaxID=3064203 RepID=UPI001BA622CC|nr:MULTISPECIES: FGGY-family carbohydrate kinase [Bradyrhizobium]MBR0928431.1 FGGY-family carbohydrate kinase [Bradyrhizobium diazoefficiens]MDT4736310.1 FGGY-family carbohydrate kinase [Bradyrhizobium sp. WYCCWR 12699]
MTRQSDHRHFLGIDVGTGSARAGVFDRSGRLIASDSAPVALWREAGDVVEQSSEDIWRAVCRSVRSAVAQAGLAADGIAGIGFDATCSLVVLGEGGAPLPVGPSGDPARNVIVWMDHRAADQARRINQTGEKVLDYVGGTISPEMEMPKLLWLAENMPETFSRAWQFMDLTDFLTWRATGSLSRSICTVTCKWTYLGHENRWDDKFFHKVGLGVLADEQFRRIGTEIVPGGTRLAAGLTAEAAADLGLAIGTPVAAGLIDAHAGGVGTVGARGTAGTVLTRMAYVFGTSACTMTTTPDPSFVPGVWGPYFSAMVPGLWLNEGGQSAAGAAIEHLLQMHPHSARAAQAASRKQQTLADWLASETESRGGAEMIPQLVGEVHVVPEFLGNRAPFADPDARALIAGLDMRSDLESLLALYLAGLCGLGCGARQIVRAQQDKGIAVDTIVVSGGAAKSGLVRQILADMTGLTVAASASPEAVLLGSAMLGSVASGDHADLGEAMQAMSVLGDVHRPQASLAGWAYRRFAAFEALQKVGRAMRSAS